MRLVRNGDEVRMLEIESKVDHTARLDRYAKARVRALRRQDLCGYVLKKDSPSCGMTRVKLWPHDGRGMALRKGQGRYAAALMEAYPHLPVEDEGRLQDAGLRENFIERIFAYRRLRDLFTGRWAAGQVVAFHTAHKLQLSAHTTEAYRKLGRLVADMKQYSRADFRDQYEATFMTALARMATRGRNTNALEHAAGHLKKCIDAESRAELKQVIGDYRQGLLPLIVPVTLLAHHSRVHRVEYLLGQTYLAPHPKELMLRNHV